MIGRDWGVLKPTVAVQVGCMSNTKQKLHSFLEQVMSGGDLEAADQYLAADFVEHDPWPGQPPTREGFKAGLLQLRTAFPDARAEVQFMLEDNDKVCVMFKLTGTHLGPFMGAPSTGKTIAVTVLDVVRLHDGVIAEHWGLVDSAAMGQQLGLTG
jgi:steroid delta-isomerase-like uncharacterized protein